MSRSNGNFATLTSNEPDPGEEIAVPTQEVKKEERRTEGNDEKIGRKASEGKETKTKKERTESNEENSGRKASKGKQVGNKKLSKGRKTAVATRDVSPPANVAKRQRTSRTATSVDTLVPDGDELTNDADNDVGDVDGGDVATPAEINGVPFNNEYDDEEDSRTNNDKEAVSDSATLALVKGALFDDSDSDDDDYVMNDSDDDDSNDDDDDDDDSDDDNNSRGVWRTDNGDTYAIGKNVCPVKGCGKVFKRVCTLKRHDRQIHRRITFPCTEDGCTYKTASSRSDLKKHMDSQHSKEAKFCKSKRRYSRKGKK